MLLVQLDRQTLHHQHLKAPAGVEHAHRPRNALMRQHAQRE